MQSNCTWRCQYCLCVLSTDVRLTIADFLILPNLQPGCLSPLFLLTEILTRVNEWFCLVRDSHINYWHVNGTL